MNREVITKFAEKDKIVGIPSEKLRQGSMTTKTIKAVCKTCNSGWMSMLETAAKPILMKLLAAQPFVLTPESQKILCQWITLKVIVGENTDAHDAAVLPPERKEFYESRKIPEGFHIWIANCTAMEWQTRYYRNAVTLSNAPIYIKNALAKNTQSTTFGFGNLFVHVMYTNVEGVRLRYQFLPAGVVHRIWPKIDEDINWPPPALPSLAAWDISQTLNKMIMHPRFIYVP